MQKKPSGILYGYNRNKKIMLLIKGHNNKEITIYKL